MDKRDKLSIFIVVLSLFAICAVLFWIPDNDRTLINLISLVGSITSPAGVAIAIIQIFKIKSNNATFLKTLMVIENNSLIDVIARSIEQVRLIKEYFDMEKGPQARGNFNILRNDINEIIFNNKTSDYKDRLVDFASFCSLMETQLYDGSLDNSRPSLSEKYARLTEVESVLQEIKSVIKRPQQDNI